MCLKLALRVSQYTDGLYCSGMQSTPNRFCDHIPLLSNETLQALFN